MNLAYKGDEVFFHHKGKPKCGKVLSTGKHGCTVEHEGEKHNLKWAHIAGHASRAKQDYKVLKHGDDGMIVENQDGHQRFIAIPPEARDEQLKLNAAPKKKPT
jgi:hypothetical protein